MDGMIAPRPEPLLIVRNGVRYGVAIPGKVAWLPAEMWAPAAELQRRMDNLSREVERVQSLIEAAQAEADAAGGVQEPYLG